MWILHLLDPHMLQKWGLRKHVWVRSGSQDVWKELRTMLSSTHQSPPCSWLLTWLSWLVLAKLPESHYGGEGFLCPSPFRMQNFHRCYKPPWAVHPCGMEQVCLLPGAMAAGVPGSLKQRVYCLLQRTWKFPIMTDYNLLLQPAGQSRLICTYSFYCRPALSLLHPCCVHPLPSLPFSFLHLSLCLHFSSHHPDPPVCPMALLSAWGLGNLLSPLLQQFFSAPHYPLPKPLHETLTPYVHPLTYVFCFTLHHLIWVGSLEKCLCELQHKVLNPAPSPQSPPTTILIIIISIKSAEGNTWNKILLVKNMLVNEVPDVENKSLTNHICVNCKSMYGWLTLVGKPLGPGSILCLMEELSGATGKQPFFCASVPHVENEAPSSL